MKSNSSFKKEFSIRLRLFSVEIIRLPNSTNTSVAFREIYKQVIRSSCSVGANFIEAQDASSRKDFFHKIGISLREAKETRYWIEILVEANLISTQKASKLIVAINEIIAILISISKKNENKI